MSSYPLSTFGRSELTMGEVDALTSTSAPLIEPTTSPSKPRQEWRSRTLSAWFLCSLIFVEIALIVTIVVLREISASNNGIATLPDKARQQLSLNDLRGSVTTLIWNYGLLWTSLPTFVFTIYKSCFGASSSAGADREPFIEMSHGETYPATVGKTIALDYRAVAPWKSWFVASKNKHGTVAAAMVTYLLLDFAVVPLVARLFLSDTAVFASPVAVTMDRTFNESGLSPRADLLSALDITSAIVTYDAASPSWMSTEYAFPPLANDNVTRSGNLSLTLEAQFARLDCALLDESAYTVSAGSPLTVDLTDRDCPTTVLIPLGNTTQFAAKAWGEQTCSAAAKYSRIGLIAGVVDSTDSNKLQDILVISCIPSYWQANGTTELIYQPSSSEPAIGSFNRTGPNRQFRPSLWFIIEKNLVIYEFFDPTDTFSANAFGRLVFQYSSRRNASNPINAANMMAGLQLGFATVYSAVARNRLFYPAAEQTTLAATQTTLVNRLFVVEPVAWTIVALLLLALLCTCLMLWRSVRTHTMLVQELQGLLGAAAILLGSDVGEYVSKGLEVRHSTSLFPYLQRKRLNFGVDKSWFDKEEGVIKVKTT